VLQVVGEDTDDHQPQRLDVRVTCVVATSRRPVGVPVVAVDLDDEAVGGPVGIGADGGAVAERERAVGLRSRQAIGGADVQEQGLVIALGDGAFGVGGQCGAQVAGAGVAGIAGEEGVERCVVQEALALGGLDGSGELVGLEDCREVEERAGEAGDRDAVDDREVLGARVVRWTRRPGRRGCAAAGTVTSMRAFCEWRRFRRWPASRWLRAAPGLQASTAAIQRPRRVRRLWPTA